jgi:hypothetical protein
MPMPPPQRPPPGWFADPAGGGGYRWWDGSAWTTHTHVNAAPVAAAAPRRRRWLWAATGAAVVVAAVTGGVIWSESSSTPAWPAGIGPIAAFVSHDRGLAFLHTVPVHFEAPKAFDKGIADGDKLTTPSARAENKAEASGLRSLGLLGGAVNLESAQTSLDSGSVLAYYDDQAKDIIIRGNTLTPDTRITLAHEMTHVLQDQHFNLTKLDDHADTSDETFALKAIEEGDAVLTQNDYGNSLPAKQQREANAEENASDGSGSGPSQPSGPTENTDFLDIFSDVPYVLGPDFVLTLFDAGGTDMINRAFERPPATELDVVDPAAYLLHLKTKVLAHPVLTSGQVKVKDSADSFGAFETFMTLAGEMDATTALAAADGWGGGSTIQYTEGGLSCTKIDVVGRTSVLSHQLSAAFTSWSTALPQHQAIVTVQGGLTKVTACDPGRVTTTGTRSRYHALDIVDERNSNISDAYLYGVTSPAVALCFGDMALNDSGLLSAENKANGSYSAPPAALQSTLDAQSRHLVTVCRARGNQASP